MYFSQNENCQPDKKHKTCILYMLDRGCYSKKNERKQNRPSKSWRAGYSGKKVKHMNKNRIEKEREKRLVFLSPTTMNPLTK